MRRFIVLSLTLVLGVAAGAVTAPDAEAKVGKRAALAAMQVPDSSEFDVSSGSDTADDHQVVLSEAKHPKGTPGGESATPRFCQGSIQWHRLDTGNPFDTTFLGSYSWDTDLGDGQPVDPIASTLSWAIDGVTVTTFPVFETGGDLGGSFGQQAPGTTVTYTVTVTPSNDCPPLTISVTITTPTAVMPSTTTLVCQATPNDFLASSVFCSVSPVDESISLTWSYSGPGTEYSTGGLWIPGGCNQTVTVTVTSSFGFAPVTMSMYVPCV